jgi:hypothetical protein
MAEPNGDTPSLSTIQPRGGNFSSAWGKQPRPPDSRRESTQEPIGKAVGTPRATEHGVWDRKRTCPVLSWVCVLVVAAVVGTGCRARPSAMTVCSKLTAAGVAAGCRTGGSKPDGLAAAASEYVVFDLPSVPGQTGQVLRFGKSDDYDATVKAFDAMAAFAGRHRYGSGSALIFVQLNSAASSEVGAKTEAIVNAL